MSKCLPGTAPHGAKLSMGAPGVTPEQFEARYGKWEPALRYDQPGARRSIETADVLLVNQKLGLKYTVDDAAAARLLPDPFPFKDRGPGLYFPDPKDPKSGHAFWPIAQAAEERLDWLLAVAEEGSTIWAVAKDADAGRDAAVALARFAYQFPTLDVARYLRTVTTNSWFGNRAVFRRRMTEEFVYGSFISFHEPLLMYDRLFDYIRGNRELAASIGRFLPWVRTPDDVVQLFDVYLLQTMAKRVLRYQWYGDGRQPTRIAEIAMVVGDNRVTDPWMEWLFSRTFFYPYPPVGIQDLMISNSDRDGRSPVGSRSYTMGDFSAGRIAAMLDAYTAAGGNPRFDLRDLNRYPKAVVSTYFWLQQWTAGLYFPRIGDVAGPDKTYAHGFPMTIDGGQRGGYCEPGDRHTRVHNTVEIDGRDRAGTWPLVVPRLHLRR